MTRPLAAIQWVPPSDPRIKWNVDGSSLGKPGEASIGGVLRNSNRDFLCIFSYHIGLEVSNMAKINAIAKALEILVSKGVLMIQHVLNQTPIILQLGLWRQQKFLGG